jgi:hypothetical protein
MFDVQTLEKPSFGKRLQAMEPKTDWSREREMVMEKTKKCAHPNCSCTAMAGKYCSVQCESMEKMPDIDCKCGHPVCKGKIE